MGKALHLPLAESLAILSLANTESRVTLRGIATTLSPRATWYTARRQETPIAQILSACLLLHMGHARRRPKRLPEKLLQIRKALGLSQRELAERLENYRTHHHISKYERGKIIPPLEVVLAYARAANVEMEQIVDDDQDLTL